MPAGYAQGQFWESAAHARRNADLPALSPSANRHHSAKGDGCSWRCCDARLVWDIRADEITARPLALFREYPGNGNVSSVLSVAKPSAHREKKGLGRYVAGARTTSGPDHPKAEKLFLEQGLDRNAGSRGDSVNNRPITPFDEHGASSAGFSPPTFHRSLFTGELHRWSTAATKNERYNKKHQENHEQDVSNPSGFSRHAAQPEGLGDKGNDQEYEGVSKHRALAD